MSNKRNIKYLWSLSPGLVTVFGNYMGSWWVLSNLIFSLIFLAILEFFLPEDKSNDCEEHSGIPDLILIAHAGMQILALSTLIYSIHLGKISGPALIFAAISTGVHSGSSSIIVAHEMIHRKSGFWQATGKFLLFTAGNIYFYVDHLRVHHKWVGTDRDPATARLGESVYSFFFRSVSGQVKSAWNVEKIRLNQENSSVLSLRNYVLTSCIALMLFVILIYALTGLPGLLVISGQWFVANFLLEYTNYIEHYGLTRPENVRVNAELSWQSDKILSRFVLIDLSRHSDHHFYASKPYHTLRTYKESPVLPAGYASCIYLVLIPAIWFKIIHPIIQNFHSQKESKSGLVNLQ